MNIEFTEKAQAEIIQIFEFIKKDNPVAATALVQALYEKVFQLSALPHLGRSGVIEGTRELVIHKNYLVIYRVSEKSITILRIRHAAQKWPPYD